MGSLILLTKIGSVTLAIGTTATIPVIFFGNKANPKQSLPAVPSDLRLGIEKTYRQNCYIIPTANNEKEKLLVCNNGSYYLLKESQNNALIKIKNLKTQSTKSNNLLIELEGNTDNSKTLAATGDNWKYFSQSIEINKNGNCWLSMLVDGKQDPSLICKADMSKAIKLNSFGQ